jgi:hypothetical protein
MSFDLESLGSGGISGLFVSIITALGLKGKIDRLEDKKQDKSLCDTLHKSINEKFDLIIKGQDKLFEKIDGINDYLRNQK